MYNWLYALIGAAVGVVLALVVGAIAKRRRRQELESAQLQAKKILSDAIKSAADTKKEALLSTKEEILVMKTDAENELKERRKEVSRQERRIAQKDN